MAVGIETTLPRDGGLQSTLPRDGGLAAIYEKASEAAGFPNSGIGSSGDVRNDEHWLETTLYELMRLKSFMIERMQALEDVLESQTGAKVPEQKTGSADGCKCPSLELQLEAVNSTVTFLHTEMMVQREQRESDRENLRKDVNSQQKELLELMIQEKQEAEKHVREKEKQHVEEFQMLEQVIQQQVKELVGLECQSLRNGLAAEGQAGRNNFLEQHFEELQERLRQCESNIDLFKQDLFDKVKGIATFELETFRASFGEMLKQQTMQECHILMEAQSGELRSMQQELMARCHSLETHLSSSKLSNVMTGINALQSRLTRIEGGEAQSLRRPSSGCSSEQSRKGRSPPSQLKHPNHGKPFGNIDSAIHEIEGAVSALAGGPNGLASPGSPPPEDSHPLMLEITDAKNNISLLAEAAVKMNSRVSALENFRCDEKAPSESGGRRPASESGRLTTSKLDEVRQDQDRQQITLLAEAVTKMNFKIGEIEESLHETRASMDTHSDDVRRQMEEVHQHLEEAREESKKVVGDNMLLVADAAAKTNSRLRAAEETMKQIRNMLQNEGFDTKQLDGALQQFPTHSPSKASSASELPGVMPRVGRPFVQQPGETVREGSPLYDQFRECCVHSPPRPRPQSPSAEMRDGRDSPGRSPRRPQSPVAFGAGGREALGLRLGAGANQATAPGNPAPGNPKRTMGGFMAGGGGGGGSMQLPHSGSLMAPMMSPGSQKQVTLSVVPPEEVDSGGQADSSDTSLTKRSGQDGDARKHREPSVKLPRGSREPGMRASRGQSPPQQGALQSSKSAPGNSFLDATAGTGKHGGQPGADGGGPMDRVSPAQSETRSNPGSEPSSRRFQHHSNGAGQNGMPVNLSRNQWSPRLQQMQQMQQMQQTQQAQQTAIGLQAGLQRGGSPGAPLNTPHQRIAANSGSYQPDMRQVQVQASRNSIAGRQQNAPPWSRPMQNE